MDPSRRQYTPVPGRGPSPVPPYAAGERLQSMSPAPPSASHLNVNYPMSPYSSTPPIYASAPPSSVGPPSTVAPSVHGSQLSYAPSATSTLPTTPNPRLPYFETALANMRGQTPPVGPPVSPRPLPPSGFQPTPAYLPPPDPNHPDLSVGFIPSNTLRYAADSRYGRERSRSPTPGFDDSVQYEGAGDVEKALLSDDHIFNQPAPVYQSGAPDDNGDLGGYTMGGFGGRSSIDKPPLDGFESVPLVKEASPEKTTRHFGPAPVGRVGRRNGAARRLQKVAVDATGIFAVDMPIPSRLLKFLPVKGVPEHSTTRYTAITTDPDDVPGSGMRLRQNNYATPRSTELFITITMYNEDAELFCRTLYGVMKNIAHLCARKNSRVWGKDGWKKVVVCIVADGRKVVNPRVLDCLAALGVYQEGAMTNKVQDRPVTAHIFEYTTSFALDTKMGFRFPDRGIVPTQIIFCMKEKNQKKINSHRWSLSAIGALLQPNICILIDVGTMPGPKSIYHLWKAFDINSNVGGACGEIAVFKGAGWRLLLNPLVAAQNFEYKMSNILDKTLESIFGYAQVLPGAFSAYRYLALQGQPLQSYFKGEKLSDVSFFEQTVFLAEDRVLCFEIVAKPNNDWVLKYVKEAVGETDAPDKVAELISQRRRWLNGSLFASVYSFIHFKRILSSGHSTVRKCALTVEFVYLGLNMLMGWFALANFYIMFVILTNALEGPEFHLNVTGMRVLNTILQYTYLGTVVACFLFSLGNRPQGSPWKYRIAIYVFAVLTLYMLICGVLCVAQAVRHVEDSPVLLKTIISLCSTYGIYVVASILSLDPWHLVTCFFQYLLLSPFYVNVLNIYSYSNLHDLSWGTKGSDKAANDLGAVSGVGGHFEAALVTEQVDIDRSYQDALDRIRVKGVGVDTDEVPRKQDSGEQVQKDKLADLRTNLLLIWTLSNALLASIILTGADTTGAFSGSSSRTSVYMMIILVLVAGMAGFRFICTLIYLVMRLFAV